MNKTEERFDLKYFGKPLSQLNTVQKREYYKLKKQESRRNDPNNKEKSRQYYEQNKEKISLSSKKWAKEHREITRERHRTYREKRRNYPAYSKSLSHQLFGCRVKDMTEEQKREYNRVRCANYQKKIRDSKKEEQHGK